MMQEDSPKVQYVRVIPAGQQVTVSRTGYAVRTQPPATTTTSYRPIAVQQQTAAAMDVRMAYASAASPAAQQQHSQQKKKSYGRKACNCSKSACLKLYCECFAAGEFCNNCNCKECHNDLDHETERSKAIKQCLERNPNAFQPKIVSSVRGRVDLDRTHLKGCHCKKSNCLKNYCECYEAKVACTSRCKCQTCRNTEVDRAEKSSRAAAGGKTGDALMRHSHGGGGGQPMPGLMNLAAAAADMQVASAMDDPHAQLAIDVTTIHAHGQGDHRSSRT